MASHFSAFRSVFATVDPAKPRICLPNAAETTLKLKLAQNIAYLMLQETDKLSCCCRIFGFKLGEKHVYPMLPELSQTFAQLLASVGSCCQVLSH